MGANNLLPGMQRIVANPRIRWAHDPQLWVELFVTMNLAILAVDIYIAHSVNHFQKWPEYIPLYFSICAPVLLALVIALRWIWNFLPPWRDIGYLIGWLSILVGLAGVLYHLESRFFLDRTLKSLTYAAPFAAPLAYTGLGFLLLVNRMVEVRTSEWARWVILLALGGFFGNFVLSLTDHAANGFFAHTEWIPVISSALATGFLLVPLVTPVTRRYLDLCMAVMFAQGAVGVLGFWFHMQANLIEPGASLWDKLVNGAPPMAPLLFPNLVGLAFIGIWAALPHVPEPPVGKSWLGTAYAWAGAERQWFPAD
ncbi:MAG TPA: hypothetical protein VN753_01620 [Terracidiphilus sp.]|jgi:hypothetical protein|nr:hypothetical protein [Terracidiphilus sp.]